MTSRRTKLSDWKVQRLLERFIAEVTLFYRNLPQVWGVIARRLKHETPFAGEVEVDESYFGRARKGRQDRGAAGKVAGFGILKRANVQTCKRANVRARCTR
jgi:transposase